MNNNNELLTIMNKDCTILESLNIYNVCLVKRKEGNDLIPLHILFSYWFDTVSIILKAVRNNDGTYNIGFRDNFFIKGVLPSEFIDALSLYNADVQLGPHGTVQEATFRKKRKSK